MQDEQQIGLVNWPMRHGPGSRSQGGPLSGATRSKQSLCMRRAERLHPRVERPLRCGDGIGLRRRRTQPGRERVGERAGRRPGRGTIDWRCRSRRLCLLPL